MKSANMVSSSTMSASSTAPSTTKMKWMMIPGHDSAADCPGGGGPAENQPAAGPENDSQRIASAVRIGREWRVDPHYLQDFLECNMTG